MQYFLHKNMAAYTANVSNVLNVTNMPDYYIQYMYYVNLHEGMSLSARYTNAYLPCIFNCR